MPDPLAWFITFTTYGTWLHGKAAGSVDRDHNMFGTEFLSPSMALEAARRESMRQGAYLLDLPRRDVVRNTLLEVAAHRVWTIHAAHVRTNHVHVVITGGQRPERIMSDMKAWTSRRLREAFDEDSSRKRWTQHGSTRWINDDTAFVAAIRYVVQGQGEPMSWFVSDGCRQFLAHDYEPEA